MTTLTVYAGLPGSGKSTHSTFMVERRRRAGDDVRLLSTDEMRRRNLDPESSFMPILAAAAADDFLGRGLDVVVDACSTQPQWRRYWLDLAAKHGATSRLVLVFCPTELAVARQFLRPRGERVDPIIVRLYAADVVTLDRLADGEGWDDVVRVSGCDPDGLMPDAVVL